MPLCFPRQECCAEASMVFAKVTAPGLASALVIYCANSGKDSPCLISGKETYK